MKGLILSGGAGTRLRPITHTSAKQLVPIANKPILQYGLESLVSAGITEIGIIISPQTGGDIQDAIGDGSQFGADVTYIEQREPAGLAHCVLIARDFLGNEPFVMYLGDNMLEQDLSGFVERFQSPAMATRSPSAQILLAEVDDPSSFGVAEINEANEVIHLVEKPADPPSNLALVGVYLFDPSIHEAVATIEPSKRGELEITDAIQWLIDDDQLVVHEVLEGWWLDTGKKDPLLECNRLVLDTIDGSVAGDVDENSSVEGRVQIAEGAQIINSTVRGPAVIGEGTVIKDSYVGPYSSIGNECRVSSSELDHSVILQGSSISDVTRLTDSLIGSHVEVTRTKRTPAGLRLMLGDHSIVEVDQR